MACVKAVNYTIVLNGESLEPFNAAKGLRQEDPISPFLFAIAMEYLSRLLNELHHYKRFKYHPRCSKLHITYLSYVDDLLLFARGDTSSTQRLQECFTIFSRASGLQANLNKSAIYYGVKVIKLIEAYCRSYMWSGGNEITKRTLIAWDKVCLPKTVGGLNLSNLHIWNIAAIAKTFWDLSHKKDKLWIKWIHTVYIKEQCINSMSIPMNASWMVRKILEAREIINQLHRPLKDKKSIIKQIYLQLTPMLPKTTWRSLMCSNATRPKAIITMWLQCQGRLLTVDRLKKWGLSVNGSCVLCHTNLETRNHLFAECDYAKRLWGRLSQWAKVQNISSSTWEQQL
ncbi:PREDICTED: uncharacterized protein LOC109212045 [Nicotiana attenuata]|uniref:uncharacterized protein LOC109212045 n=1 Tax=Nicotiana attenuata TaxID=49451 RepID=UPI0009053700|nr:PREDICTED: uncharacterized protein LOC109212045 [Nicotiana attenuata]